MVLKVSISLPNQVAINMEASEAGLVREMVRLVLRELPAEFMQISTPASPQVADEISIPPTQHEQVLPKSGGEAEEHGDVSGRESLGRYYQAMNPIGDMRRIVVAAAGASHYLAMQSVSAVELGDLFDLASWSRPSDFVQTLRNAARSNFRWMERVPGRRGYYSVSNKGRAAVIGSSLDPLAVTNLAAS